MAPRFRCAGERRNFFFWSVFSHCASTLLLLQSMTESHFVRRVEKCPCLGCCPKTDYAFVSPDGANHKAKRHKTTCCERQYIWCCCKPLKDTVTFKSDAVCSVWCARGVRRVGRACPLSVLNLSLSFFFRAQGPDFQLQKEIPCAAWCACPLCIPCCRKIEITDARSDKDAKIGTVKPTTCCEAIDAWCCPWKNHVMFTTKDVSGADKFVLR